jgi:hypothetical protein
VVEEPSEHFQNGKLWMGFKPKGSEIDIDYSKLDPLIKELKKVWNSSTLPDGRDGCDDCKRLELLFGIDEQFQMQDQYLLKNYKSDWRFRDALLSRRFYRQQWRQRLLTDFDRYDGSIFASDGIVANWEFAPDASADQFCE